MTACVTTPHLKIRLQIRLLIEVFLLETLHICVPFTSSSSRIPVARVIGREVVDCVELQLGIVGTGIED